MYAMFFDARSFNQNISSWKVANVKDMDSMFAGTRSLLQKPHWYKN